MRLYIITIKYILYIYYNLHLELICITLLLAGKYADLDALIDTMLVQKDGEYHCLVCHKHFKSNVSNARVHIESQHVQNSGIPCELCGFISKTRDAMRKHMRSKHLNV